MAARSDKPAVNARALAGSGLSLSLQRHLFFKGADLVLAVDCVPFTYTGFHQDFLKDCSPLVAYPNLDGFQAHLKKLADILSYSSVKSLAVMYMEVPCCFELVPMARQTV